MTYSNINFYDRVRRLIDDRRRHVARQNLDVGVNMKAKNLMKVSRLIEQRDNAASVIKTLGEIIDLSPFLSMPHDVFKHVDRVKATKALEPLVREALIEYEKELAELGVEL